MSNEKVGTIRTQSDPLTGVVTYSRTHKGINLPSDYMTDDEIAALSGEVKTYYMDEGEGDE